MSLLAQDSIVIDDGDFIKALLYQSKVRVHGVYVLGIRGSRNSFLTLMSEKVPTELSLGL